MRKYVVMLGVALAFLAFAGFSGAVELAVTTDAALEGTYGLGVTFDGASTNTAYVHDDSPNDETVYRFQFRAELNDFDSLPGDIFYIVTARSPAPNNLIRVWIRKRTDGSGLYQLRVITRRDSGSSDNRWTQVGGAGFGGNSTWEVEWTQASAAGANDGRLWLWKNGGLIADSGATLDNDERGIGDIRMGHTNQINVTGNIATGTTGTLNFDSFESYRTLRP